MGVVYHSNYIVYFEVGRTEYIRSLGCRYRDLEAEGYVLAVIDCGAKFHRPAEYDDLLSVRVRLTDVGKSTLRLEYEICRDGAVLVTGHTSHAFLLRATMKPVRMPEAMRVALDKGLALQAKEGA
jgi:acyl-CoA thioester hydrolase